MALYGPLGAPPKQEARNAFTLRTYGLTGRASLKANAQACHCAALSRVAGVASADQSRRPKARSPQRSAESGSTIHVLGFLGVSLSGFPSSPRSLFGLMMAGEPGPGESSTFASTWRRNSSTSLVECFEGSMCVGCWRFMAVPVRVLKDVSCSVNLPVVSVSQAELRGWDPTYRFTLPGIQREPCGLEYRRLTMGQDHETFFDRSSSKADPTRTL